MAFGVRSCRATLPRARHELRAKPPSRSVRPWSATWSSCASPWRPSGSLSRPWLP